MEKALAPAPASATSASNVEKVPGKDDDALFPDIDSENPVTEMQSLCMNCEEQGVTRLLLTRIPYFRDVILMSFSCPHCNWKNTEIQSAESIAEKGCRFELIVKNSTDLNRQVVKAPTASIVVPELNLEIPANTQRGSLNTIEGCLAHTADSLEMGQDDRKKDDPAAAEKVGEFIERVRKFANGEVFPFAFILDDPAGNSYVQNRHAPKEDPDMKVSYYMRTPKQDMDLGIQASPELQKEMESAPDEILSIPTLCSECHRPGLMKSVVTDIPHFHEVVLMAFACEHCGYKSNEVRGGGAISEKGRRMKLSITCADDLNRDVLKSETAGVEIPEIELELSPGTLGGKFTTIEGLLMDLKNVFKRLPFVSGDSADVSERNRIQRLVGDIEKLLAGNTKFTIIFDDPLAASYIQNPYAPDRDPNLVVEEYERTFEQDEHLGINALREQDERDRKLAEEEKAGEATSAGKS